MSKKKHHLTAIPIATTLDVRVVRSLSMLIKAACAHSGNHPNVRASIFALGNALRLFDEEHEHETTLDVTLLMDVAREVVTGDARSLQQGDVLSLLIAQEKLSPPEQTAAKDFVRVWTALSRSFGRMTAQYEVSGGKGGGTARQPIMSLSDEELEYWSTKYRPWYEGASKRKIRGTKIPAVQIVVAVLIDHRAPSALDQMYRNAGRAWWPDGLALTVLKRQLADLANYGPMAGLGELVEV